MIKKSVLKWVAGMVLFICFGLLIASPIVVKLYIDDSLESLFERPVEIEAVKISYFPLKCDIKNIHIINLDQPEFDLFVVDSVSTHLQVLPLVFRRLIFEYINIDSADFMVKRSVPYQVTLRDKKKFNLFDNKPVEHDMSVSNDDLVSKLDLALDVSLFKPRQELAMHHFLKDHAVEFRAKEKLLRDQQKSSFFKSISSIEKDMDTILGLKKSELKTMLNQESSQKMLLSKKNLMMEFKERFSQTKADLINIHDELSNLYIDLDRAYQADFDAFFTLGEERYLSQQTIFDVVLAGMISRGFDLLNHYKHEFDSEYASLFDIESLDRDYNKQRKGAYVSLRFGQSWPLFAIKHLSLTGESTHHVYSGELINLTTLSLNSLNKMSLNWNHNPKHSTGVVAKATGGVVHDLEGARFVFDLNLKQEGDYFFGLETVPLKQADSVLDIQLDYFNQVLDFDLYLIMNRIQFGKELLSNVFVRSFLYSIDRIEAALAIDGPLNNVSFSTKSTLDKELNFLVNMIKKQQSEQLVVDVETFLLNEKKELMTLFLDASLLQKYKDTLNKFDSIGDKLLSVEALFEKIKL